MLAIGHVRQVDWDDPPLRILGFDDIEVHYDSWWPHSESWGLSTLKGKATYYRTSRRIIDERTVFLRDEPLTEEEASIHRPDLPLRMCRSKDLQWSSTQHSNIKAFAEHIRGESSKDYNELEKFSLSTSSVVLAPFGPKGSQKRGTLLKANNGRGFSGIELLWHAFALQAPFLTGLSEGVGIYRLGFQQGAPSYYLWGFHDQAGLTEDG